MDGTGYEITNCDHVFEFNMGTETKTVQQTKEILGSDVASGAGCVGATSESGDGTVERRHAHFQAGQNIR